MSTRPAPTKQIAGQHLQVLWHGTTPLAGMTCDLL
jgi:hypothetical protein